MAQKILYVLAGFLVAGHTTSTDRRLSLADLRQALVDKGFCVVDMWLTWSYVREAGSASRAAVFAGALLAEVAGCLFAEGGVLGS